MTNHVHLLLTPTTPLSACSLMKGLGQRYVQNISRTYQRTVGIGVRPRFQRNPDKGLTFLRYLLTYITVFAIYNDLRK
ncbi:hypothetical protein [Pseudomonas trivialis]|uniref:hypothetical protein n=1 Tax=Pseudomonas trivialis TaxID=200450 RepID=UPI001F2AA713|nr:hypothetical protein [Pseudomonas trivialis]